MKGILKNIYIEITNTCNLSCAFCPDHARAPLFMTSAQFAGIMQKITGKAETLYFHVKGEPLLHPGLSRFLDLADAAGFPVKLTTNGTLLGDAWTALAGKRNLERLNVSLQSLSCFPEPERKDRIRTILDSVERLFGANLPGNPDFLVSLRLWTRDNTADTALALGAIESFYGREAGSLAGALASRNSLIIHPGLAVHTAETFTWPSLSGTDYGPRGFCRALRDQAGILADGTVVPCCLDGDGVLSLGNIFDSSWDEIISAPKARAIYKAFTDRNIAEPLCRRCGYRTRFN